MDVAILRAGIGELVGGKIISADDYRQQEAQASGGRNVTLKGMVSLQEIFNMSYRSTMINHDAVLRVRDRQSSSQSSQSGADIQVRIKTLAGREILLPLAPTDTIDTLKAMLTAMEGWPADQQRVIFNGQQMASNKTLRDCNITNNAILHLVVRPSNSSNDSSIYYLDETFLDPPFNFDARGIVHDAQPFKRGGYDYHRPLGYFRFALKVVGKYADDDWLGPQGIRHHEEESEWAVAYHGAANVNGKSIAQTGFDAGNAQGSCQHGVGIYSTPTVLHAGQFATKFSVNGENYKMIFQSRVNPVTLVRVDAQENGNGVVYLVSPTADDVRPYGICVKKI